MSDERKPDVPAPSGQITVTRSSRYQEVYANSVRFKLTPIDLTMTLGTTPDIPGAPVGIMQDEASITVTHSFMKVLARHLSALVQGVEKEFGPIRIEEKNNPKQEQIEAYFQALKTTKLIE
jgi:hypothetical protein